MAGFNHVISSIQNNWLAKRKEWETNKYIYSENGNIFMHLQDGSVEEWSVTVADLMADDWEVRK